MTKQQNSYGKSGLTANTQRPDSHLEKEPLLQFPLGRNNFRMMGIAGLMIVAGFLLMLGGASTEEAFNPDIFSARRIVVGPAVSFLGFLFMGYAIIRKPSKTEEKIVSSNEKDDETKSGN